MGFNALERQALAKLRRLPFGEGDPLLLLLVGLGRERDFRSQLLEEANLWISATPLLVSRYPKTRGTKRDPPEHYATPRTFAAHVLRQELGRRPRLPAVAEIQSLQLLSGPGRLRPIQSRLFRQKRGGGRRPSGVFRIVFASPVRGPLCLGHSCPFGLGLFVPDRVGSGAQ
jgi:CRISPR-associated protein Csb2